jgi:RNA polymerase sigma-70 factor (ECF subfamily)
MGMQSHFDDQDAMRRILAQNQEAFQSLYSEYGKAVYSLAYRVLHNAQLAEEVTQDTFLKVWHRKAQWDPNKGKLLNWLLAIAHFTAIDHLRKENRQPHLHPESIEEIEYVLPADPSSAAWQDSMALRMLLTRLSKDQATLIEMAFYQGMSHSDIVRVTNIPLGTVKTRLRRGLQRLREMWLESVRNKS